MHSDKCFILGVARSVSSMLSNILVDNVLNVFSFDKSIVINAYEHNPHRYFEGVKLTLLKDKIVNVKYDLKNSIL